MRYTLYSDEKVGASPQRKALNITWVGELKSATLYASLEGYPYWKLKYAIVNGSIINFDTTKPASTIDITKAIKNGGNLFEIHYEPSPLHILGARSSLTAYVDVEATLPPIATPTTSQIGTDIRKWAEDVWGKLTGLGLGALVALIVIAIIIIVLAVVAPQILRAVGVGAKKVVERV